MAKYIFVTGGVVSSLGKGITAASLGRLLKNRGLNVSMQKFDPYINVDPGTMSPYQHGEVFVTDDGAETDLDLGHYERFTDINLTKNANVTTGKVYWSVISKERKGDFLGGTVQVIPHITNEIKDRAMRMARENDPDVVICEIGGTVGDIESLPFLEAIRQLKGDLGRDNVLYIHVTLVPYLAMAGEAKTKPTQHSVKELRSIGIQPDIIVCRSEHSLSRDIGDKIALFCDIEREAVIQVIDEESIYTVPLRLAEQGLDDIVIKRLNLKCGDLNLDDWEAMVYRLKNPKTRVEIALVGKYVELPDAYLSVVEALYHGGLAHGIGVDIRWVAAGELENRRAEDILDGANGILVPGGFGDRGVEGKISAIHYARENRIPFMGICLGMQLAAVEYARNVCKLADANSTEFDPHTAHPVVDLLPEQKEIEAMGGTMRLGVYPCRIERDSLAHKVYEQDLIYERHRHRYEFNKYYRNILESHGMTFSGFSPDNRLMEVVELRDHPWFLGCMFHPGYKSRPTRPHPLFKGFVQASSEKKKGSL
ncbi:MAG: CTP synthase [Clostridia bacterium]|nr:CTP synthase [Clostridia bacterium]